MKKRLDISVVANNDVLVRLTATKSSSATIEAIKWQAFGVDFPTTPLFTKRTSDGAITITEQSDTSITFTFRILASDTEDIDAGEYIHEAVTVDEDGHPVTVTNNDPKLTAGKLTIREQHTVQD